MVAYPLRPTAWAPATNRLGPCHLSPGPLPPIAWAPATNHLGPVAPATNHLGPVSPAIRSVRSLEGGSSVDFDGLVTPLPEGARPRRVSFWVRAAHQANIGYFTLGGASTQSSVIFFHL